MTLTLQEKAVAMSSMPGTVLPPAAGAEGNLVVGDRRCHWRPGSEGSQHGIQLIDGKVLPAAQTIRQSRDGTAPVSAAAMLGSQWQKVTMEPSSWVTARRTSGCSSMTLNQFGTFSLVLRDFY